MTSLLETREGRWRTPLLLLLLGVLYCGLNALKPIQIDDGAYYYFARQIAKDPLNPYGFQLLWYDNPWPANYILAPPVLPSTWALALKVCGDSPALCKWFLLPWSWLLVAGLHGLFRRFAAGWEWPLTAFTAFSPALLPSLNFMLDVPALALSLGAVHLFLRACDEDDFKRAVLAGLLAGLAIETKYTGLIAPVMMVFAGTLFGRWRCIPAAALTTAQVFVSWELLMALQYDRSHFFVTLSGQAAATKDLPLLDKLTKFIDDKQLFVPVLFTLVGSVTPVLVLLALAALRVGRRWLLPIAGLLVLGILWVALDYAGIGGWTQAWLESFRQQIKFAWEFKLSDAIFFIYGVLTFAALIAVGARLLLLPPGDAAAGPPGRRPLHLTIFLLLWLAMEVLAYFPLTPFPAVRRVLGIVVVGTVLTGRLVAQTCRDAHARWTVQVILAAAVVVGLGYFALDCWCARAQEVAADEAADWVQANGGRRVWYAGHWGFQYYAEHRDMQPLFASAGYRSGRIEAGDFLVLPDQPHNQQALQLDWSKLVEAHVVVVQDVFPLTMVPNYYGGTAALEHHEGPRMTVRIYKAVAAFEPRPPPPQ